MVRPGHGRHRDKRIAILVVLLVLTAASEAAAQGVPFNQRDDRYPLLGLRRAKEAYEVAREDLERRRTLHEQGLISKADLERAENAFSDAEVNYQQSLLAVLFEEQVVTVSSAVKRQARDGTKRVRLLVANASGASPELQELLGIDDPIFRSLQPDRIRDVYVSLSNDEGAIVSEPYESKIEELRYGSPEAIEFTLLQDLDVVTVNLFYGNGSSRSMKIYLQKDASANRVVVQAEPFSQEIELGSSATYDLTLELFSSEARTFRLETRNLPPQIDRYFTDPATGARLSQFRFLQSANTRRAALQVSLPDRATAEIPIDRSIPFYVLVIPEGQERGDAAPGSTPASAPAASSESARTMSEEEIAALGVGYARLELVPRGNGILTVNAPQLFHRIRANESVTVDIDLSNEGTRRLDNVSMEVDAPLRWSHEVAPSIVPALAVGEEKRVRLSLMPDRGTSPGRYEVRLRTRGLSENRPIHAEDKVITVEISPGSPILATVLLSVLILGLVTGVVWLGIRLSRR
ncbi:MAG: NEW3 domain-containing protein [Candidatus Eisenbacteria bacterium]|nr:NEW3 domain-containing protein [Candidatus Eisenbacteria bacterium]